ncbi:tetratricopeptide repeat protein [Sphaerotilus hippei]|uniref:Tetratricopeptide repeat protein n=1 Tax=Sphaerotilus hippei TaxID=744406 RepID=A0A318H826_9BURK|nr:tetratricopeptide repeat protein [Sphaerotilus hippei]PXW95917.1 tetratricopeptide repeat protein [Sphaerotilus hippei]
MSDAATVAPLDAAAQAWLDALAQEPVAALGRLLMSGVWLGAYAALEPAQALPQFLPTALEDTLDTALQGWLGQQLRQNALPPEATPKQYALALTQAGVLMQTLSLPHSVAWCRERAPTLWAWLNRQPSFASRDPRSAFLRALALHQTNRDLLPFWMGLCRQGQPRWAALALFGLRRMPVNDDGQMPEGLPTALVGGLLDYGLSLYRHAGDAPQKQTEQKRKWLAELDFLSAVYPMSSKNWQARLRDALTVRSQDAVRPVRHWLDERWPAINQPMAAGSGRRPLEAPHWVDEVQPLLHRFDAQRAQVAPQLRGLMAQNAHYAQETGDAHFLVRSYCRLADFLLKSSDHQTNAARDAPWALQLGQQAVLWAPGNPQAWSVVARALDELGDWPGAQTVFWYARRRFPYEVKVHAQLGHALAMRGQVAEGEAVYRAAIRRFPDNPVCWADLGNTLRIAQGPQAALAVYRQAQQRFHDGPICCSLTGVLIDLGQVAEAQAALAWAQRVADPNDKKAQGVLDNLQRRFQQLASGQQPTRKPQPPRPQGPAQTLAPLEQAAGTGLQGLADLGCATLWRQAGELGKARQALSQNAPAQDVRWQAEEAWLIAQEQGWPSARAWLEQHTGQHPGDGVLAALRMYATEQSGGAAEWGSLRGRFEELAPLIRVRQDRQARLPDELSAALKAVENASGEPQLDELDDDFRMALSVYQTAQDDALAPLVQQDYLAARQLSLY